VNKLIPVTGIGIHCRYVQLISLRALTQTVAVTQPAENLRKPSLEAPAQQIPAVSPVIASLTDVRLPPHRRISSDIVARISKVENEADFQALDDCLRNADDHDTVRNEVANLLRRSNYLQLADSLIFVLENAAEKPRFRAFAVQHLGGAELPNDYDVKKRVAEKLQSLLQDKDVEVRREALLTLTRKHEPLAAATAVEWLSSPHRGQQEVRDLAIRCIRELGLREHAPIVKQLASDENESVRIAAIVTLSDWQDVESATVFEAAARSNSTRLHRAGQAALNKMKVRADR